MRGYLPKALETRIAEHPHRRRIGEQDLGETIEDHDCFGRLLDQVSKLLFGPGQCFDGLLPLGDSER